MATGIFMCPPYIQFLDENGAPMSGALVYTYAAGGSTWQKIYTDSGLITEWPQPAQADSAGRLAAYAQPLAYKIVVKKSDGSAWWTQDNYFLPGPPTAGGSAAAATLPDWMTALIY